MGRLTNGCLGLCVWGLTSVSLFAAPGASAKLVVVGSPLTGEFSSGEVSTEGTYFNSSLSDPGANVVSPVDGAIIAWNMLRINSGPYRFRVLSPDGGSSYTATESSRSILVPASGEVEFPALHIEAGDTVGVDMPVGARLGARLDAGPRAAYAFWVPPLEDGASLPYSATETGVEMGFNAIVLPEPRVTGIGPKVVPTHETIEVRIRGRDFMRVIKVSFGGVRAARWTVVNNHLIVARTRATTREARTHVRVQTAAGTSPAGAGSAMRFQDAGRR